MKLNISLLRGIILMLCLTVASVSCAQDIKKEQAKASPSKDAVVNKKTVVSNKKVVQKKKTAATATPQKAVIKRNRPQARKTAPNAKVNNTKASHGKASHGKASNTKASSRKATAPRKGKKAQPVAEKTTDRYIALKTNLPYLALVVQNLALEVQVHKHITIDFPVMWSISDIERKHALRTIAFQPEGRWWLKSAGEGHFFGLHTHVAWFNAKWQDNRYQTGGRPLLGAGISYGYKLPLSAHWGAEFNIGAGYANMKYNTYYNIENGAQLDSRIRHYWGITRLGLSLVYRF